MTISPKEIYKILVHTKDNKISVSTIQRDLTPCSIERARDIFKYLLEEMDCKVEPYNDKYNHKKYTLDEWEEGDEEPYFIYKEQISQKEQDILLKHEIAEKKYEYLKNVWSKNRIIWYGILDVCDSEKIQSADDERYNTFIQRIHDALEKADYESGYTKKIFLGEIGDAFKVAITQQEIIMPFIDSLDKNLDKDIKLRCSFFSLKLKEKTKIENYFRKTIAGTMDINSEEITKSFRTDANTTIKKKRDFHLAVLLDRDIINITDTDEFIQISQNKDSKENNKDRWFYPIVYTNNGKLTGREAKAYYDTKEYNVHVLRDCSRNDKKTTG